MRRGQREDGALLRAHRVLLLLLLVAPEAGRLAHAGPPAAEPAASRGRGGAREVEAAEPEAEEAEQGEEEAAGRQQEVVRHRVRRRRRLRGRHERWRRVALSGVCGAVSWPLRRR